METCRGATFFKDTWGRWDRAEKYRTVFSDKESTAASSPAAKSSLRTAGDSKLNNVNPEFLHALSQRFSGENSEFALLRMSPHNYALEYHQRDSKTGEITITIARYLENGEISGITLGNDGEYPEGSFFPMMKDPSFVMPFTIAWMEDDESLREQFVLLPKDNFTKSEVGTRKLSDEWYQRVKKGIIPLIIPASCNFPTLSEFDIAAMSGDVICGDPHILGKAGGTSTKKKTRHTSKKGGRTLAEAKELDWVKRYRESNSWTTEQRKLIPIMPDDMILQPEVLEIARMHIETIGTPVSFNNIFLRGTTGYGKSTLVRLIGALLDTPVVDVNANNETATDDLLTQFAPKTADGVTGTLPTAEELVLAPETAWFKMTGEKVEEADPVEVMKLYTKKLQQSDDGSAFELIRSNLVLALANGYICEIAEPSRIKQAGALVGLNNLDKPGAVIPLKNGGYVRRDPKALVIYTDNVNLTSTKKIDESVLSRMVVIDTPNPDKTQVLARVQYNTGCTDSGLLELCYETWEEIRTYVREHDICGDAIALRELDQWVKLFMISEEKTAARLKQLCKWAVYSKASTDPDVLNEIRDQVVEPHLARYSA